MVSQKNVKLEKIHEYMYFKLNDEILYFTKNACQTFKAKKGVLFFNATKAYKTIEMERVATKSGIEQCL